MQIEKLVVGEFAVNCYVVSASSSRDALVIDPGSEGERILEFVQHKGLTVVAYLLTHGHMDHISGLAQMCDVMPAPVAMHSADLPWAFTDSNQMLPFYPAPRAPSSEIRTLEDGQEWTDSGMSYRIISSPGHTPGSICIEFPGEKAIFSGDTLFAGSIGRTDFHGGDSRAMSESLLTLAGLDENTSVYPGHGESTDIARELATNPFMQSLDLGS